MSKRRSVFEYALKKYGSEPDYLWPRYPGYAVLRHNGSEKWYAIVMDVSKEKLGIEAEGEVDVIDVKCSPRTIEALLGEKGFLPAYHMNKVHWISILLDGTVPLEKVYDLIDTSYELTRHT